MLRFILILLVAFTHVAVGLIGYDCQGPSLNITTVSLNTVGDCDLSTINPVQKSTYVQLLQLSEFDNIEVQQCRVEIDRTIYYCGMSSHNSIVSNGRQTYFHDVDARTCARMQETGLLQVGISTLLTEIKGNSTTTRGVLLAGKLESNGRCSGAQYSDPFGYWENVVVQATIKVALSNYMADVNFASGKIVLRSGSRCSIEEGSCMDIDGNSVFWKTQPTDSCAFNHYDVLYEGLATKFSTMVNGTRQPDIYTLNAQDTTFALAARSSKYLCGYEITTTEHPKLFIVETQEGRSTFKRKEIRISNLDIFTYMNSKFIYIERHIRTQIKELYKDVLTQRCRLERQVLQNALSIATSIPGKFAEIVMKKPGYTAVVAGEVAHIIKCVPVSVHVRRSEECYNELPITYRNESRFLLIGTKTIVKYGTQIHCNPVLPALYYIDGDWFRFTPHPVIVSAPQIIGPSIKPTWTYSPVGNLATSGIYSNTEIEELRDRIMFPVERPALLNNVARGTVGYSIPPGTISLKNLLDEETLNHMAENAVNRFWHGFEKFGVVCAGIFGIFLIYNIIKGVIDTCIHGFTLHSIYGCSFTLCGAIWTSLTQLLVSRAQKKKEEQALEMDRDIRLRKIIDKDLRTTVIEAAD